MKYLTIVAVMCLAVCTGLSPAITASPLNPAREITVIATNHADVFRLGESVVVDGEHLLAQGKNATTSTTVFVFQRHFGGADAWNLRAEIVPPVSMYSNVSGLALSGDIAAVGDTLDSSAAYRAGAVHLFYRNFPSADQWGHWLTITPPDAVATNGFGYKVALNDRYLAVTVANDATNAAYLFGRNTGGAEQWGLVRKFVSPISRQLEDASVALSGDRLVMGAWKNSSNEMTRIFERNAGGPDNWGLAKSLTAAGVTNFFGFDVAMDGDTVVVGAYLDNDAGPVAAGAAYVFARNQGGADNWGQVKKLLPDIAASANFGRSVSIRGDTILAAAPVDPGNTNINSSGAAYVFNRNRGGADNWGQTVKLISKRQTFALTQPFFSGVSLGDGFAAASQGGIVFPGDVDGFRIFQEYDCPQWDITHREVPAAATNFDAFGSAVAIDDRWLAVGAPHSVSGGNTEGGVVYLYDRNQGGANAWGLSITLPVGATSNHLGSALALNNDLLAVGMPNGTSLMIPQYPGQVSLRERNRGGLNQWGELTRIIPADAQDNDEFGTAVALSGDALLAGAPLNDFTALNAGAAYMFNRNQGGSNVWGQVVRLVPSGIDASDQFGTSLALNGDWAAVGAPVEDDPAGAFGSVHLFYRNAGGSNAWSEVRKIKAGTSGALDRFGQAVALWGDYLAVGSPFDDDMETNSGAVYLYERNRGGANAWGLVKKMKAEVPFMSATYGIQVALRGERLAITSTAQPGSLPNEGRVTIYERNAGGTDQWGLVAELASSAPKAGGSFGTTALASDRIVVGAPDEDAASKNYVGAIYFFEPACQRVTTTDDIVSPGGDVSLREAINNANASTAEQFTIIIPEGTFLVATSSDEDLNASGDFDITNRSSEIILRGQGARRTILNGGGKDRVLQFHGGTTGELREVTIKNGQSSHGAAGTGAVNGGNGRNGGGIFNDGNWRIVNSMIISNFSGNGGNAQVGQGTTAGRGGRGGGVVNNGTLLIRSSTIARNRTGYGGQGDTNGDGGSGGGIYDSGSLNVQNSTLWNNLTGDAGGAGASDGSGGGIFSDNSIAVRHSTIADNQAGQGLGGGIYVSSPSLFNFSILDDNAGANAALDGFGTLNSPSYNSITVTNGLLFTGSPVSNIVATLAQLSNLTNALGPTDILLPGPSSPVIDKGDSAFGSPLARDQRGFIRPTSGITIDLGAVETSSDFDGDGMSDAWEIANLTNPEDSADGPVDLDGDGDTTAIEYVADTNPYDGYDVWQLLSIVQTNSTRVYFDSSADRLYTLRRTSNLVEGTWSTVAGQQLIPGTGAPQFLTHTNNNQSGFYSIGVRIP